MIYPSVWTGYYVKETPEECCLRLKKAGFDRSELSHTHAEGLVGRGDPEAVGTQLRRFLENEGFRLTQGHLTFTPGLADPACLELMKKELSLFLALGIRNAVVHFNGGNDLPPEARQAARLCQLRALQAHVNGTGLFLCLENLGSVPETHTAEKILGIMDSCGGENLGICLDTGHLHLVNGRGEASQSQREFILAAGKHLKALHITENNGKNDVHQMPYSARYGIDWPQVVQALKEIGYDGLFNFEVLGERNAPEPIKADKLQFMHRMAGTMLEG